jgi:hypothetical protein
MARGISRACRFKVAICDLKRAVSARTAQEFGWLGGRWSLHHGAMEKDPAGAPVLDLSQRIRILRGQRVLLDSDLAMLYGVTTKRLNEQVRRNDDRFPADFLLELSNQELASLRSQFATLKTGRGGHRKYPPLAFTEHGAVMAATILNSPQAAAISVYIVRAFVRLRAVVFALASPPTQEQ